MAAQFSFSARKKKKLFLSAFKSELTRPPAEISNVMCIKSMTAHIRLQQDAMENSEVAEKQHSKQTFGVHLLNIKIRKGHITHLGYPVRYG